jgi:hypothetical protein
MIVEVVNTVKTPRRWFKQGQQFLLKGTRMKPAGKGWELFVVVDASDGEHELPEQCVALLPGDDPRGETPGPLETMYEYIARDPTQSLLGKKDAVMAAREFLGVDIAAKPRQDQADYNGAYRMISGKVSLAQAGSAEDISQLPAEEEPEKQDITNEFSDKEFNPDYT